MSSELTRDRLACPLGGKNGSTGNARSSCVPSWREKWLNW